MFPFVWAVESSQKDKQAYKGKAAKSEWVAMNAKVEQYPGGKIRFGWTDWPDDFRISELSLGFMTCDGITFHSITTQKKPHQKLCSFF